MFDYLLTDEQKQLKQEAREFVKTIPRQMILDMDADKIRFPKEFLQEAGRRNLMGCRYPEKWGGRGMDWVSTCMVMEEVGMLGNGAHENIRRPMQWTAGTNAGFTTGTPWEAINDDYTTMEFVVQILMGVLDVLIAEDWPHIMIEVDMTNTVALSLYRSCGFQPITTFQYYQLAIESL